MALSARRPLLASVGRRFDMRELWRVGLWGIGAATAVTLAAFAAVSSAGTQRIVLAVAQIRGMAGAPPTQTARVNDRDEVRRLAESVRVLAADRDRLLARIDTLERSVDDMTGSITRQTDSAARQTEPPAAARPAETSSSATATVNVPVPRPAPLPPQTQPATAPLEATTARAEFGIDLGGASSINGLRGLWAAAKSRYGAALDGLRPIISLRETGRPGGVELRLVAGPFSNAASAARVCGTIAGSGALCQPALFDGQRLEPR
jgi:hypothetical protein